VAHPDTIRGLQRGLQVLQVLQTNPIASLHEIHLATRIPKPSLLRILNTLEKAGVASRRLVDGKYRVSALGPVSRKRDRYDRVVEAAAPVLHRLCQKVLWPSDLAVPAGDHLQRRETNRPFSPFRIQPPMDQINQVGQPLCWLMTGLGRAYLAFCPAEERERILRRLRSSTKPEDRLAREPKRLDRILSQTRARGFGTRDSAFVGGVYGGPPTDDGLAGMAVPLLDGSRAHGVINVLWIRTAFTVEDFAARYLDDLQAAAGGIIVSLRARRSPR
jgi:IclR family transcriptional regulator, mhp operon transcriptional activator